MYRYTVRSRDVINLSRDTIVSFEKYNSTCTQDLYLTYSLQINSYYNYLFAAMYKCVCIYLSCKFYRKSKIQTAITWWKKVVRSWTKVRLKALALYFQMPLSFFRNQFSFCRKKMLKISKNALFELLSNLLKIYPDVLGKFCERYRVQCEQIFGQRTVALRREFCVSLCYS